MGAMASQATSLTIVYSTVYSGIDQRKHKSSASLAFVRVIHRWPVNSPHKWPVTRNMFPLDDVIMSRTRISPCITPCIPTVPFHVGVSYMCMSLSVYEQFSYRLEILHRLSLPSSVQNFKTMGQLQKKVMNKQNFVRFEFELRFGRISQIVQGSEIWHYDPLHYCIVTTLSQQNLNT